MTSRPFTIALVPALLLAACALGGVDAPGAGSATTATTDGEGAAPTTEQLQMIAAQQASEGLAAMKASDNDTAKSIDAAIAFSKALHAYEQLDDQEACAEMRANIFWCKKRMNLDDLRAYLARKGEANTSALQKAVEIADAKVPATEAKEYYDRAAKFAVDNAGKPLEMAIRWFEVAERFKGTEWGDRAQTQSMDAQRAAQEALKLEAARLTEEKKRLQEETAKLAADKTSFRETRFTKPAKVVGPEHQVDPPAAQPAAAALANIKSLYKDDYAKRKPFQKLRLAKKLIDQVAQSKDDAASVWTMLKEAERLALECDDYDLYLTSVDTRAAWFTGVDAIKEKKADLGKMKSKPIANAIVTLIEKPDDAAANTIAGRFFCLEARKWDLGMPMLALGSDVDFKKVAEMDGTNPTAADEQTLTADRWYDLVRRGNTPTEKTGMQGRAFMWYSKAVATLTGVAKDRATKRIAELDKALPLTSIDWDNLTASQWDKLKAAPVVVEGRKGRTNSGITLKPGMRLRVVPHPSDTFTLESSYYGKVNIDWKGNVVTDKPKDTADAGAITYRFGTRGPGAMQVQIGDSKDFVAPGIHEGNGVLYVMANGRSWYGNVGGSIRIKVLTVKEEEE